MNDISELIQTLNKRESRFTKTKTTHIENLQIYQKNEKS